MARVLVIGATSAIAEATCQHFAARGDDLYLLGRDEARLAEIAEGLGEGGAASVVSGRFDALDSESLPGLIEQAFIALGGLDIALIAHGTRPDQARAADPAVVAETFHINAVSVIACAEQIARIMERQGFGQIAVITSIAGDRGRKSNALYAASKAAVDTYLEGLRQRVAPEGIVVTTIKPGFVETPMTAGKTRGALGIDAETAAAGIVAAIARKRAVVYLPWYWRWIMLAMRLVPGPVFRRLSL